MVVSLGGFTKVDLYLLTSLMHTTRKTAKLISGQLVTKKDVLSTMQVDMTRDGSNRYRYLTIG